MTKSGIELIAEERQEQLTKHGRTIESDVNENQYLQLVHATAKLLSPNHEKETQPFGWSEEIWNRMRSKQYKERLIIAGALIAAEIDRIQNDLKR
jgi:hypothetical protein